MADVTASARRRGRPPGKPFPPSRRKMLDDAKRDALAVAYGQGQSADFFRATAVAVEPHRRWFVVVAKPQAERAAAAELRAQGFAVFLPMEVRWTGSEGRRIPAARPCVPRYLFVRFDPAADPWQCIWSTRGVHRLVSFTPDHPAPVRDRDILAVHDAMTAPLGKPDPSLAVARGDRGHASSGPFASFPATVEELLPDGRILVSLTIMGRATPITLEPGEFTPAGG